MTIDGIIQPTHGRVINNNDGSVIYLPDFGFTGVDSFKYWASDQQGNFTPATVNLQVQKLPGFPFLQQSTIPPMQ